MVTFDEGGGGLEKWSISLGKECKSPKKYTEVTFFGRGCISSQWDRPIACFPVHFLFFEMDISRIYILHTQRNFFEILLNQIKPKQIIFTIFRLIWNMVNTIRFRFDLIRFRKDFSVRTNDRETSQSANSTAVREASAYRHQ